MDLRFALDGMLGTLARWLRICGYDAEYLRSVPDEGLIQHAAGEGRILLTRDKLLYRKALRAGVEAILVKGNDDVEKLAYVSKRLGIGLNPEQSRCPKCGGEFVAVEKEAVKGRVPPRTYEAYNDFWVCRSCGQIYWQGSHWRKIVETLREASERSSAVDDEAEQTL